MERILRHIHVVETISRDELQAKIERGDPFVLIETLSPQHYEHAHLPGAINLPSARVTDLATRTVADKRTEIVVYCANVTCRAAENAAHELRRLGYVNVRRYPGGKHDWIVGGLPIEKGALHRD